MLPHSFPDPHEADQATPQRKEPHRAKEVELPYVPEPLLDSDQAAKRLQIHPKTLQRYARQGYIKGFHIGTMWRFRASDIESWILRQTG
jgi:excisionase family DNA binding protein